MIEVDQQIYAVRRSVGGVVLEAGGSPVFPRPRVVIRRWKSITRDPVMRSLECARVTPEPP
ncbi:MAG: hypothetical protein JWR32_249 [Mycobacterium sp.]|jgi:hypothetical protein|nr:hypothetical protein [Mycobacterium sp.]